MNAPEQRITSASPETTSAPAESYSEEPLVPKDYWTKIWWGTIFFCFLLIIIFSINPTRERKGLPILIPFCFLFLASAFLFLKRLTKQRAHYDTKKEIIIHGQTGFLCRHSVKDVIALQLLRVPPQSERKARYQLNLITVDREHPRCFLIQEVDYLSLLQKGREWAAHMKVPLLDLAGREAKQLMPAWSENEDKTLLSNDSHFRTGEAPAPSINVPGPPVDLGTHPMAKEKLFKAVFWVLFIVFLLTYGWWNAHSGSAYYPWDLFGFLGFGLVVYVLWLVMARPIIRFDKQLYYGFPGFRRQVAVHGLQLLIVEDKKELCEINVVTDIPGRPRVHFTKAQGLAKTRFWVGNLAKILEVPVWEQKSQRMGLKAES